MKSWVRGYLSDSIGIFFFIYRTVHLGLWPPSGSICRCFFPKLFSSSLSRLFSIPITISFIHFPRLVRSAKSVWFVFPTGSLTFGWFYEVRSLAPHPPPNLEDQGISVSLGSHPWPVWQGRPCRTYTTTSSTTTSKQGYLRWGWYWYGNLIFHPALKKVFFYIYILKFQLCLRP